MPRRNGKGFGDLFLQFEVDFPDKLTNKQKEAIRMVFAEPEEGHDEGGDEL